VLRVLLLLVALLAGSAVIATQPRGPDASGTTDPSAFATSRAPSSGVTITPTPGALRPIPEGYRVRVPRLGIDLPIQEGVLQRDVDQQQTPEGYAFHLPGSALPGEPSNTYLYAHARRGMFLSLWDARVGDAVEIVLPDGGVRSYRVSEVRPRVPPDDVSVAQPTPDERLTLQTSTGASPADPRFVVIALPR
jgi:LPXTG-site transpeptidase (sortase) family protein